MGIPLESISRGLIFCRMCEIYSSMQPQDVLHGIFSALPPGQAEARQHGRCNHPEWLQFVITVDRPSLSEVPMLSSQDWIPSSPCPDLSYWDSLVIPPSAPPKDYLCHQWLVWQQRARTPHNFTSATTPRTPVQLEKSTLSNSFMSSIFKTIVHSGPRRMTVQKVWYNYSILDQLKSAHKMKSPHNNSPPVIQLATSFDCMSMFWKLPYIVLAILQ